MSHSTAKSRPSLRKAQGCFSSRPVPVRGHWTPDYCRSRPKQHPAPESVRIASRWRNPAQAAQEITPAFLEQLADDWDAYATPS